MQVTTSPSVLKRIPDRSDHRNTQMYIYDVQYVDFRTDQVKEMGAVTQRGIWNRLKSLFGGK